MWMTLLFLLPLKLAEDLHQATAKVWDCTVLQALSTRAEALKFLAVEIETCHGGFLLSQQAYIGELPRAHQVPENRKAKIPAPKELLNVERVLRLLLQRLTCLKPKSMWASYYG